MIVRRTAGEIDWVLPLLYKLKEKYEIITVFENRNNNQINLFEETNQNKKSFIKNNVKDWLFEEKLSKEFESIGFFVSDHPINAYK